MNFFKTLIAATLGTIIALLLIFFILLITVSASSQEPEPYIQSNSVLKFSLSGTLPSQPPSNPFDELLGQNSNNKTSLQTLKENLSKAQTHDNISGIWLEVDMMTESWANLQEAHRVISAFRDSSEKFVYASTNDIGLNEKGYYLATAADSIFAPPESFFEFDGFYNQVTFYDGAFEKLGIEAEVIRQGKYKGAVEPFYRKELSEENEYQLSEILNSVNSNFSETVSAYTGRSVDEINSLMNEEPNLTTHFAYSEGLIDSLMYVDEVENHIKKRVGVGAEEALETVSNSRYAKVSSSSAGLSAPSTSNKVAVIYANGPILPDMGSSQFNNQPTISASFIEEQLEEIRNDDNVKALVLRINSPGGSGSTSDIIWRMLQQTKTDIPVIASMGGVAASGGYYIAMAADSIVAEPTTVTGSIGVFATKFNARQLLNDKLGLTFDAVKSHDHADWLVTNRELSPSEEKAFQQYIGQFYQTFIGKVAESRNMDVQEVDQHAQGRVWTGSDAQEVGLVDQLGGMDRALGIAAEKANISDYSVVRYPKPKSFYELLMGSAATQAKAWMSELFFGTTVSQEMQQQMSILNRRDALTLFPYKINVE
jgi:protease-4